MATAYNWGKYMADTSISPTEKMNELLNHTERMLKWVCSVVYERNNHDKVDLEDLEQSARLAICENWNRFDGSTVPNTFFKFYVLDAAVTAIHASLGRTKYEAGLVSRYCTERGKLMVCGINPTTERMAKRLNLSVRVVKHIEELMYYTSTLGGNTNGGGTQYFESPEAYIIRKEKGERLHKSINSLSEMDKAFVDAVYFKGMSLGQASNYMKQTFNVGRISKNLTAGKGFSVNRIAESNQMILAKLRENYAVS